MAAPGEVKSLMRAFLRGGAQFPNYNIREYILRRVKDGFREGAGESGPSSAALWAHAKEEYSVMKRQSVVYGMYARKIKNILEVEGTGNHSKPAVRS
ncbi:hypothetical protein FOA52_008436 [Chlamydomonas sp. UWO 241]|nr:hypothetical protein FOA52_008436 [Chlamydomonas sp. UWO 241]